MSADVDLVQLWQGETGDTCVLGMKAKVKFAQVLRDITIASTHLGISCRVHSKQTGSCGASPRSHTEESFKLKKTP